jgi:hypothetical protein
MVLAGWEWGYIWGKFVDNPAFSVDNGCEIVDNLRMYWGFILPEG